VAVLRLFAGAREAAGTGHDEVPGTTVAEVIEAAVQRYGVAFARIVEHCQVWRNGEPAEGTDLVSEGDEVAVLPPVSGGCR
jgi:sulfur-carrier protein